MRCKAILISKLETADGCHLKFGYVVDGSAENKQFFRYTPGGEITMQIVNKATANTAIVGKAYYVDFTIAEEAPST